MAWALQRDRWILWLPVGTIAGAAAWLAAPTDPPRWAGAATLVLALGASVGLVLWPSDSPYSLWLTIRRVAAGLLSLTAAVGLGLSAGELRMRFVQQPAYVGAAEPVVVEGWVTGIDASESGPRLRLLVRSLEDNVAPPRLVRVAVRPAGLLTPGRGARCLAVLGPPAGPMAPGAYDFARRAYFEQLGAVGYAFGRCRPVDLGAAPSLFDRLNLRLAAMRYDLSAAIQAASPGRGGAIAAALITGDRSAIDANTNETLQNSGLGHLLSVSGIHMGVVGGLVFAALIWTFSLIPPLALRVPVKKLAAIGALTALALYLIISGSSVPALRAFVMAGVAFGAILLDRPAISMRGLALAALLVTLAFPESVLEPGFQMSFAATMALVALFEMWKRSPDDPALPTPGPLIGSLQAIQRGIGGVILISLVAGLATDPFALYHFQRFATYALPANIASAPIMSFLVAPAAGAAAVLAPFGLADPAIDLMAAALDLIAAIGQVFGERPEAVRALPKPPDLAFALCVGGLLWACLWRGHLRWGGVGFLAASVALYVTAPRPVLAFDADLRAVYARNDEGAWTLIRGRGRSTYAQERLGGMLGLSPAESARLAPPDGCGGGVCAWRLPSGTAALLVEDAHPIAEACIEDAVVLTRLIAPPGFAAQCKLGALWDATDIAQFGGAMIYDAPDGLRIERALPTRQRPWTPRAAPVQE